MRTHRKLFTIDAACRELKISRDTLSHLRYAKLLAPEPSSYSKIRFSEESINNLKILLKNRDMQQLSNAVVKNPDVQMLPNASAKKRRGQDIVEISDEERLELQVFFDWLRHDVGLSIREIAFAVDMSKNTIYQFYYPQWSKKLNKKVYADLMRLLRFWKLIDGRKI